MFLISVCMYVLLILMNILGLPEDSYVIEIYYEFSVPKIYCICSSFTGTQKNSVTIGSMVENSLHLHFIYMFEAMRLCITEMTYSMLEECMGLELAQGPYPARR